MKRIQAQGVLEQQLRLLRTNHLLNIIISVLNYILLSYLIFKKLRIILSQGRYIIQEKPKLFKKVGRLFVCK